MAALAAEITQEIELLLAQRRSGRDPIAELQVVLFALHKDRPGRQTGAVGIARFCKTNPSGAHGLGKLRVGIVVTIGIRGEIAQHRRGGAINRIGKRAEDIRYFRSVEASPLYPPANGVDAGELILENFVLPSGNP